MTSETARTTTALNGAAVAIVTVVVLAYTALTIVAMRTYDDAKDVVAVLGVVVGPLAGIAAAAFGIKLSADAKAEAKDAKAEAQEAGTEAVQARTETERVKHGVRQIADELSVGGHETRGMPAAPSDVVERLRLLAQ